MLFRSVSQSRYGVVVLCFLVGYRFALCFVGFDVLLCCNVVGFGVFLGECMAYFCNIMAFLCIVVLCFLVGYRFAWCFGSGRFWWLLVFLRRSCFAFF